jgi:Tol biopolymer transport system component
MIIVNGQEQQAQQLLSEAVYEEEVNGELEKAIELYQKIVTEFPNNRSVAAKAYFHMGMCYEKLGLKEAQKAYSAVVNNYPDQQSEVVLAKERLSRLILIAEKEPEIPLTPIFTKIRIPTNPGGGVLTPDGDKLAFISDGAMWIIPIHGKVNLDIAGEPIRIAEIPGAWDYGSLMSWSADGKWIAVNGEDADEGTVAYIIPMAGGESRTTPIPPRGGHSFSYRLSLSPDGQILAFSAVELGVQKKVQDPHDRRIYTVPVKGGEPKQISSVGVRARLPSFSPDGKFIAYVGYSKGNIGELWIVPSTGGNPIKLAKVNGRLRGPVWSPDGKYIAAHYEPGNTNSSNEILVYPLSSDLSTTEEPTKITLPGESYNILAGWTPDDELGVFVQSEEHSAIYTVPASGGKAVQVSPDGQWPYYPRWSPNGKRIYFRPPFGPRKEGDVVNQQSPVLYVSATGGNPVGIPVASNQDLTTRVPGGGFNISPDGKKIVISTGRRRSNQNESNLWTISLEGGQQIRLTSNRYFDCRFPCWSPDGKWIAFIDDTDTQDKNYKESFRAIYTIPAEGGEIRQITSKADSVGDGAITFSTNGEHITFFSGGTIKTKPVEGGQSKVLVTNIKSGSHSQLAYSPDGSKIAHNAMGKIYITSFDEGKTQELLTGLPESTRLSEFGWSPDSKKIAIFCSSGGEAEFWMVSNFLPLEKLVQNKAAEANSKFMTNK